MYIKSVTAQAFGPLVDQTLELSPGLTVVHGDNESAKSTWHAAIYAALCGRRGRPRAPHEEKEFTRRRRPWHCDSWRVRCEVVLDDGRCVTLQHDLEGRVDCRATDQRGLDVSGEIMVDGAPDGSKWLGLNRRAFAATASVNQAELLSVLEAARDLQRDLQRAAATAGKDETAASALETLRKFRAEEVGLDRANSVKPLRRAAVSVKDTRDALSRARQAHEDYLRQVTDLERASEAADQAAQQCGSAEAAAASARQLLDAVRELRQAKDRADQAAQLAAERRSEADRSRRRSARVAELAHLLPDGAPPTNADDDELAQQVMAACAAWDSAPHVPELTGESADELRRRFASLPPIPEGDLRVDPDVERLRDDYLRAAAVFEATDRARVPMPTADQTAELQQPQSVGEMGASEQQPRNRAVVLGVGAAVAAVGVVLLVLGHSIAGLVALAAVLVVAGAVLGGRREERIRPTSSASAGASYDEATSRAEALAARQAFERWQQSHETARSQLAAREAQLTSALQRRGFVVADVSAAYSAYEQACGRNAAQAREAELRPVISRELSSRVEAERAVHRAREARAQILAELSRVAGVVGVDAVEPDTVAVGLSEWLHLRRRKRDETDAVRARWQELQGLLEGGSLADLAAASAAGAQAAAQAEERAGAAVARVAELETAVANAAEAAGAGPSPLDEQAAEELLRRRRTDRDEVNVRERQLRAQASQLSGQVLERERCLPDVAEAEEAHDGAEAELARLESLGEVLDCTSQYLAAARDKAYTDLAPVLNEALERWLPEVTSGRYQHATVDPESLEVRVELPSGELREAGLLSVGTAEQVYLLLRIALAEHLATGSAMCPLLLDDVTVQADPVRTEAILQMCKTLADEGRQVVLFAQEPAVATWAQAHLDHKRDALISLEAAAAA